MDSKEKKKYRNKWLKQINVFRHDMADLLISRKIYCEIGEILEKNIELQKRQGLFFEWIKDNYVARMVIAIRRLTDNDQRSISFTNFLDDLKNHPAALDRTYFISKYSKNSRERGSADFDFNLFANKGQNLFSKNKLERDKNRIIKNTERIKRFADKWIAHHDRKRKKKMKKLPTFEELHRALDDIDRLICKYYLLLTRAGMRTCEPTIQFDWKEPLRIAWIP